MRRLWMIMLTAPLAALPACTVSEGHSEASPPTVTYEFDDRSDYDVVAKADLYCEEHYDRDAVLLDRDVDVDDMGDVDDRDYRATFACE